MTSQFKKWLKFKVEAEALSAPSDPLEKVDPEKYLCFLALEDPRKYENLIREYIKVVTFRELESHGVYRDPYICAEVLVTYYLKTKTSRRIEIPRLPGLLSNEELPDREPDYETKGLSIWVEAGSKNHFSQMPDPEF